MFYPLLIGVVIASSVYLYDTVAESKSNLDKYNITQREKTLHSEQKLIDATDRYYKAYGVLPATHLDLVASGFISTSDTSIIDNQKSKIANKYQKALSRYVSDKNKTPQEINTLFNAQNYAQLPQDIKTVITEAEYNIVTATKIDYKVVDGEIIYSDEISTAALDSRIDDIRDSKTLNVRGDNTITNNMIDPYNKMVDAKEKQLEQAVITTETEDVTKITEELKAQNYSQEKIDSMMKIFEAKRDKLNLY